jgi:RNA polymerase sigma-70 factor, ECF subfamily
VERTLVERAMHGDEGAYASLASTASDRLLAIAYRVLRDLDQAEDAVQVALVSAWRDLPTLREPDRFDAWLTRLLIRACYGEARRQRRWSASIRVMPNDGATSPDMALAVADRDQLDRGFRRLPTDQRAVFVLHHYVGLTLVEIAQTLDIPLGTAKSRLHYATQTLRAALDADARTVTPVERLA